MNWSGLTTDIAVIIVSYNNLGTECLSSLATAIVRTKYPTKVLVVDNNSTDVKTHEKVPEYLPQANVIYRDKNYGFGRSMNFAATKIDAKYYFLLNPDTYLSDPETLNKLVDYLEARPDTGLLAPKLCNFDGSRQDSCRRFPAWHMPIIQRTWLNKTPMGQKYIQHFLMHNFDQTTEAQVDWVQGSAMFIPSYVWRLVNGFDDRFWMYFEDVDLCRRIWQTGYRVTYLPDVVIHHAFQRASAQINNLVLNVIKTRATRAHISSWMKYMWKWRSKK